MTFLLFVGTLLSLVTSLIIYISSPNQQWFYKPPFSYKIGLPISLAVLLGSGGVFSIGFSPLASLFTVLTLVMLFLSTIPFITRFNEPMSSSKKKGLKLVRESSYQGYRPHWTIKCVGAGLVCLPFSILTSSLIGFIPFANTPQDVTAQFQMWLTVPIALTFVSLIFFSRYPWRVLLVIAITTVTEFFLIRYLLA